MSKKIISYLISFFSVIVIVALYSISPIRLLNIEINKDISDHLLSTFNSRIANTEIVILNISRLDQEQIVTLLNNLLLNEPKKIGINICGLKNIRSLPKELTENPKIILANCNESVENSLARQIEVGNIVTHFKRNRSDYFEFKFVASLDTLTARVNKSERIKYSGGCSQFAFMCMDVSAVEDFYSDFAKDRIVLLGTVLSFEESEISNYTNARITPMNTYYGQSYIAPDMSDTEISANIISSINKNEFLNEVSIYWRTLILLLFVMVQVTIINLINTRWLVLNLILVFISFLLLTMGGSALIVYFFSMNYYLELNEMTLILIVVTLFTFFYNMTQRSKSK